MMALLVAGGIAVLSLLLLAASGPLYRFDILSLPSAFTLLRWGAYGGVAAMIVSLPVLILAYAHGQRVRVLLGAAAFLLGAAAFGIPFQWQQSARAVPPIHDVTTDLENPPAFEAVVPLRAEAPNSLERPPDLARLQREGYPDLGPVTLPVPLEQAFDRALAEAQEAGWRIVTADRSAGRLEATDTTRWFGFEDDIVVRLTPWGAGTRVDVRSVSRVGRGDAGTNARRIRSYLAALQG